MVRILTEHATVGRNRQPCRVQLRLPVPLTGSATLRTRLISEALAAKAGNNSCTKWFLGIRLREIQPMPPPWNRSVSPFTLNRFFVCNFSAKREEVTEIARQADG
jgi:hypothetical protein